MGPTDEPMTLFLAAFWISTGILVYGYLGFPVLVAVVGGLRDRRVRQAPVTPYLSLIIAAYNEEEGIRERLENALACDYPPEALEIIVASDGSSDGTERIVSGFDSKRVRLLSLPRRGKAYALNEAVRQSLGEVLVFSDANTAYRPDALRKLARNFADPEVGGVAGHTGYLVEEEGESAGRGEDLYWRYDTWLKRLETRTGSVVSAHGGMYAIRRELFQPIEDAAVTDDFAISTGVVEQGRRLVFEPEARGYEGTVKASSREFQRRVRLMTRGLRGVLVLRRRLLDPRRHGFYSVALFSHKVLRRLLPLLLPVLFVSSIVLHGRGILYSGAAIAQGLFYALALGGWALRGRKPGRWKLLYVPFFYCMANLASVFALAKVARGHRIERWSPQRHEGGAVPRRGPDPGNGEGRDPAPEEGMNPRPPREAEAVLPAESLDALNRSGIHYCVVSMAQLSPAASPSAVRGDSLHRGARPPSSARLDRVSLLVDRQDAPVLEEIFHGRGFALVPAASPRFRSHLLGPSAMEGGWLRIDLLTELRYGSPPPYLRMVEPEGKMLRRRRWMGRTPVLSPEDELVELLLRIVLEEGGARPTSADRLRELVAEVRSCPAMARRAEEHVERELAPAVTWDSIIRHVTDENWVELRRCRARLGLRLLREEEPRTPGPFAGEIASLLSPDGSGPASSGRVIAVLCPDGGGKSTVVQHLSSWLPTSPRVMSGGYPRRRRLIPPQLQRPASFWSRALRLRWLRARGHLVLVDRYVFDGWVDEAGLNPGRRSWGRRVLEWPFPRPDLVVILDAPGEELYRRSGEHSPAALEGMRQAYLSLRDRIPGVVVIDATRPPEEVVGAVTGHLWPSGTREGRGKQWAG